MSTRARIIGMFGGVIATTAALGLLSLPKFPGGDADAGDGGSDAPTDQGVTADGTCGDQLVDACSGQGSSGCAGFGGPGGTGGQGGGASIALLASGPTTTVTVTNGGFFCGSGGRGGQGGVGGIGSDGDAGSAGTVLKCSSTVCFCSDVFYDGGAGGAGGPGGQGGQGGGGAGGPTFWYVALGGAVIDASAATITASKFLGDGGQGGAPNGIDGVQTQHFP